MARLPDWAKGGMTLGGLVIGSIGIGMALPAYRSLPAQVTANRVEIQRVASRMDSLYAYIRELRNFQIQWQCALKADVKGTSPLDCIPVPNGTAPSSP